MCMSTENKHVGVGHTHTLICRGWAGDHLSPSWASCHCFALWKLIPAHKGTCRGVGGTLRHTQDRHSESPH